MAGPEHCLRRVTMNLQLMTQDAMLDRDNVENRTSGASIGTRADDDGLQPGANGSIARPGTADRDAMMRVEPAKDEKADITTPQPDVELIEKRLKAVLARYGASGRS